MFTISGHQAYSQEKLPTNSISHRKIHELIIDLDKDDVLDTISVYDYKNITTGYYPHYVEYKLSQLKYKSLKSQVFDMPHPRSLGLDFEFGGICISSLYAWHIPATLCLSDIQL